MMIEPIGATAFGTVSAATIATAASIAQSGVTNPGTGEIVSIYAIGAGIIALLWRTWRAEAKEARNREAQLRQQIADDQNDEIERLRTENDKLRGKKQDDA